MSADQKRNKEELESRLLVSLQSGEPLEVTAEMWEELRQALRSRAEGRNQGQH